MKKYNLVALCGIALLSSSAFASSDPSGFYVLGAVGTTGIDDGGYTDDFNDNVNISQPSFDSELETKGSTKTYSMGYQINRIVGVEATYMDYGRINLNQKSAGVSTGSSQVFAPESFSVSANLGYSFHNGLRPFAKIGISYIDFGVEDAGNSSFKDINGHGGIHIGAGVEYALDLGENHGNVLFRTGVEGDIANVELEGSQGAFIEDNYNWSIATLYAGVGYRF
ncbi:outer membrane protein [Vibrio halioticoli]|uniref:Outer membrane protein beta-barrel domain-containing protein n=1 Tax=Vibrio halioticoli NBRC 102217 TaxID=1219072 RepID=V5F034_9VIBR|nr:outer membrane beta-barrel protein [Vibrio halioticoli]GAD88454.1 hypothetical protein VHA01S_005_00570 [Vibrio halioticoli NBRC 102217]